MIEQPIHTQANLSETSENALLPAHRVRLEDSSWTLWRSVCVRGAGFPAQDVLKLAMPECIAAASRLIAAEKALVQQRDGLLAAFSAQIKEMLARIAQGGEETAVSPLKKTLNRLRKGRKKLYKSGNLTRTETIPADLCNAYQAASDAVQARRTEYEQVLAAGTIQVSKAFHELLENGRYQEAITWQNRTAIHTGLKKLLQTSPGNKQNRKTRQREALLASYIQRYAVKNDSIGFFGPIGWAQFTSNAQGIDVQPGQTLLATRNVYFEDWAITSLAETLSQDNAFRPWFIPRLMPYLRVEGSYLHLQVGDPVLLSPAETAVYHACDGKKNSRQISLALIADPHSGIQTEADLFDILQKARDARRMVWAFSVPIEDAHPEKHFRHLLEQISDATLREKALQPLNALEAARTTVAQAAGHPAQLDQALAKLDETFTRLSGVAANRRSGATYAARTLVYEDCRRDVHIDLGDDLLKTLTPPLSLLLTSARWYTFETAKRYRLALRKTFLKIRAQQPGQTGASTVDFPTFWLWAQELFFGNGSLPTDILDTLFQKKWEKILALPDGQRRVQYRSQALQARVKAQFRAPHSGWQLGRYHNPDIILSAPSVADVRQGNYHFVLGEFHMGFNGLLSSALLNQHPAPDELRRQSMLDVTSARIMPLTSRQQTHQTSRTQFLAMSPDDLRLVFAADNVPVPGSRSLPISELVVGNSGRDLVVRTRDGRFQFDIINLFAHFIGSVILDNFKLVSPREHTPRIAIDKLIVRRESWRLPPEELTFATETDTAVNFLAAQRWRQIHQMPRFVFVKTPIETKPMYIDFDSPIYVRIFSKLVRQTQTSGLTNPTMTISEMLPSHENLWLTDADNQRFTSEMRMVVFDELNHTA